MPKKGHKKLKKKRKSQSNKKSKIVISLCSINNKSVRNKWIKKFCLVAQNQKSVLFIVNSHRSQLDTGQCITKTTDSASQFLKILQKERYDFHSCISTIISWVFAHRNHINDIQYWHKYFQTQSIVTSNAISLIIIERLCCLITVCLNSEWHNISEAYETIYLSHSLTVFQMQTVMYSYFKSCFKNPQSAHIPNDIVCICHSFFGSSLHFEFEPKTNTIRYDNVKTMSIANFNDSFAFIGSKHVLSKNGYEIVKNQTMNIDFAMQILDYSPQSFEIGYIILEETDSIYLSDPDKVSMHFNYKLRSKVLCNQNDNKSWTKNDICRLKIIDSLSPKKRGKYFRDTFVNLYRNETIISQNHTFHRKNEFIHLCLVRKSLKIKWQIINFDCTIDIE